MERQVLKRTYFRIDVAEYTKNLYNYTEEGQLKSNEAVQAFYNEVIGMLQGEGWTLKGKYGNGICPTMVKESQELYCHPQDICGIVEANDIEKLKALFENGQTFRYRATDVYDNFFVVKDDDDLGQLYKETYPIEKMQQIFKDATTTKRRDFYKRETDVVYGVFRKIYIKTTRSYGVLDAPSPGFSFVCECYEELKKQGLIVTTMKDGINLCRWISKYDKE